ncbi:MAG: zinc-ribbon domain-containing protein, partial [Phycisphaerae bacterium]
MPKCPSCSFEVPAAAKFCPSCGKPMSSSAGGVGSGGSQNDDQDMLQTAVSSPPMTPKFATDTRPGNQTVAPNVHPTMTHASMPSGSIND